MFWFNLACYHCQLGDLEKARECLGQAVGHDGSYRKMALTDPDLEPLWDSLKAMWS